MNTYIAKRLLLMVPTLFGVSIVVWVVLTNAPEPPIETQMADPEQGEEARGEMSTAVKVFRAQYGLDKPALLNFYFSIDTEDIVKALRVAEALGDEEYEVRERNAARTRLIEWGQYAVPNLLEIVQREEHGPLRESAASWLVQLATRVPLVPPSGRVDADTAARNEEVVRENRILRAARWRSDDSVARKNAGAEALANWMHGIADEYPDGKSTDEIREALEAGEPDRIEGWGEEAVAGLVQIVLEDEQRRERALPLLLGAARREGDSPAAELHNRIVAMLGWPQASSESVRRGALATIRSWWYGVADRWDYSGTNALRVLFLETQFARYWNNLLRFDLGESTVHRRPVIELILARLKYSLSLAVPSLLLAFLISVPLGLLSATLHGTLSEKGIALLVFALYSLPSFFVATLVIRFFATGQPGSVEWFPEGGFEEVDAWKLPTGERIRHILWHIAAPLFCMTYTSLAALSRYAKTGLLNVIRSDYVRTARAKGLSEFWVVFKHAARNGIIPVITLLGTSLPIVIGGSFVIETIFNIPGFGLLMVHSVRDNDYTVIIGVTLITAVLTMVGILLSDLLYAVADPRISYS